MEYLDELYRNMQKVMTMSLTKKITLPFLLTSFLQKVRKGEQNDRSPFLTF